MGESTTLIPTLEPSNAKKRIKYSSSDASIATVNNEGVVKGIDEGTVTITASVNATSRTVSIIVTKPDYAVDKLIINTSGSTAEEISPYVNYRWKEGQSPILCRVVYDKNSENGLQIIAVNPVRKVKLGYSDENPNVTGTDNKLKSLNSYNRAIETLNEYAVAYMDTKGIASDARCVGSDPRPGHKNDESGTVQEDVKNYGTISIKNGDTHYMTDQNALKAINSYGFTNTTYGSYYWVASRSYSSSGAHLRVAYTYEGDAIADYRSKLFGITKSNTLSEDKHEYAFRPVFLINSGVKIIGGTGSQGNPYELDI